MAQLGDPSLVQQIPRGVIEAARKEMKRMLEGVIEQMKVSSAPVHMLLCGGGALLVTEELDNVEKCIQPIHQGAANAVGAAIAKVSGDIDIVEVLAGRSENDLVESARRKAIDLAVRKGASRDDVQIVEMNKMLLQYTNNAAVRIQIRAVGKLAIPTHLITPPSSLPPVMEIDLDTSEESEKSNVPNRLQSTTKPSLAVDLAEYRSDVRQGVWYVSEVDLELISTGYGVLGTGGGGPTHHEYLKSLHSLRNNDQGKMRIIAPEALEDTDVVCFGSWYGSPSVINERIAGGDEIIAGIKAVGKMIGRDKFDGIFIDEIGGGNGMSVFPTGVELDIPVIDGDAMGRAYSTKYHATFSVYGHSLTPCALADAQGNTSIVMFNVCAGKVLYTGKTVDVQRYIGGGYTMGTVIVGPASDHNMQATPVDKNSYMVIPFQNEYLYAASSDHKGSEDSQKVVCTVPDLISIPSQDGEAIGSQDLQFGIRVSVAALPSHPLWKTEQGLRVGGPEGFGLKTPVVSVDNAFNQSGSVISDFSL